MPLPQPATSPQHYWMYRPSKEKTEWPFSVKRESSCMRLYGVHCKCSHIDLKCQESWAHAHTPHTPHLSATGSSDGGVLLCSVERCSTGRSSQNKQQEESGPLAHSCDLFHLSLSFTLIPTVCQAERCLPFIEHPLTPDFL